MFDFGHNADNPISSGNGFANALLGVLNSYSERDNRVDRDNLHWYSAVYVQDSWRMNVADDARLRTPRRASRRLLRGPRRELGLRSESVERRPSAASSTSRRAGSRPGTGSAGLPTRRRSIRDSRTTSCRVRSSVRSSRGPDRSRTACGSTGSNSHPDRIRTRARRTAGTTTCRCSRGRRASGFAWDVFGDGKTAIRASTGVFYNFVAGPVPVQRRCAGQPRADDPQLDAWRRGHARGSGTAFAESPQGTALPERLPADAPRQPDAPATSSRSATTRPTSRSSATSASTPSPRSPTSRTSGGSSGGTKTTNNIPIDAYANPDNLFNNEPINANFLRRDYHGVGSISYLTTDDDVLNYNAMQTSVQRRLSRGLQMGLAYTLSWNEGMQGWDFMTEELGGKQALRDRYYGPPAGNPTGVDTASRIGGMWWSINYCYMIPNPTPNVSVLKHVLRDWEASGVSHVHDADRQRQSELQHEPSRRQQHRPVADGRRRALRVRAG